MAELTPSCPATESSPRLPQNVCMSEPTPSCPATESSPRHPQNVCMAEPTPSCPATQSSPRRLQTTCMAEPTPHCPAAESSSCHPQTACMPETTPPCSTAESLSRLPRAACMVDTTPPCPATESWPCLPQVLERRAPEPAVLTDSEAPATTESLPVSTKALPVSTYHVIPKITPRASKSVLKSANLTITSQPPKLTPIKLKVLPSTTMLSPKSLLPKIKTETDVPQYIPMTNKSVPMKTPSNIPKLAHVSSKIMLTKTPTSNKAPPSIPKLTRAGSESTLATMLLTPPTTSKSVPSTTSKPVSTITKCPELGYSLLGEKKFGSPRDLLVYLKKSGLTVPLFCGLCEAGFFHKDGLETHWYEAHGPTRVQHKTYPSTQLHLEPALLGKFPCKYCTLCFGSVQEVMPHVLAKHPSPFYCTKPRCSYSSENRKALEWHGVLVHCETAPADFGRVESIPVNVAENMGSVKSESFEFVDCAILSQNTQNLVSEGCDVNSFSIGRVESIPENMEHTSKHSSRQLQRPTTNVSSPLSRLNSNDLATPMTSHNAPVYTSGSATFSSMITSTKIDTKEPISVKSEILEEDFKEEPVEYVDFDAPMVETPSCETFVQSSIPCTEPVLSGGDIANPAFIPIPSSISTELEPSGDGILNPTSLTETPSYPSSAESLIGEKQAIQEVELKVGQAVKHPELGYQCFLCAKYMRERQIVLDHVLKEHLNINIFACQYCEEDFIDLPLARRHHLACHGQLPMNISRKAEIKQLDTHAKQPDVAQYEKNVIQEVNLKVRQQQVVHQQYGYQCYACTSHRRERHLLVDHVLYVHKRVKNFICSYCDLEYFTVISVRRHHKEKHQNLPFECRRKSQGAEPLSSKTKIPAVTTQIDNTPKVTTSKDTNKKNLTFPNFASVEAAKAVLLEEKAIQEVKDKVNQTVCHPGLGYQCYVCDGHMENQYILKQHILHTHLKIKDFRCDHCNTVYHLFFSAKRHHVLKHSGLPLKITRRSQDVQVFSSNRQDTIKRKDTTDNVSKDMDIILSKEVEPTKDRDPVSQTPSSFSGSTESVVVSREKAVQEEKNKVVYVFLKSTSNSRTTELMSKGDVDSSGEITVTMSKETEVPVATTTDVCAHTPPFSGSEARGAIQAEHNKVELPPCSNTSKSETNKIENTDSNTTASHAITTSKDLETRNILTSRSAETVMAEEKAIQEVESKVKQVVNHPELGYRCYLCSKYKENKPLLKHHVLYTHLSVFYCDHCDMKNPTIGSAKQHHEKNHQNLPLKITRKFQTPKSNETPPVRIAITMSKGSGSVLLDPKEVELMKSEYKQIKEMERNVSKMVKTRDFGFPCYLCSRTDFKWKHILKIHILQSHLKIKRFQCRYCEYKCNTKTLIRIHHDKYHPDLPLVIVWRHLLENTTRAGRLAENKTNKSKVVHAGVSTTQTEAHKSLGIKGQSESPPQSVAVKDAQLKESQVVMNPESNFRCDLCSELFSNKDVLKDHILSQHLPTKEFSCQYCYCVFLRKNDLRNHHKNIHSNLPLVFVKQVQNIPTWRYNNSGVKVYSNKRKQTMNIADIDGKSETEKKTKISVLEADILAQDQKRIDDACLKISQIVKNSNGFQCYLCPRVAHHRNDLTTHVLQYHLFIRQFQCKYCQSALFYEEEMLKQHIANQHPNLPEAVVKRFKIQNFTPEEHPNLPEIIVNRFHIPNLTPAEAIALPKNNEPTGKKLSFKQQRKKVEKAVQRILRLVENPEYGFQCYICNSYIKKISDLKRHVMQYHLKIKDLKCKYCNLQFYKRNNLKRHLKKSHPNRPMLFVRRFPVPQIDECNNPDNAHDTDDDKTKEEREKKRVQEAFEKIANIVEDYHLGIQCYECNYTTRKRENLNKHVLKCHLQIKDLKCKYCDMKFLERNNLSRHIRKKHPDLPLIFVRRFPAPRSDACLGETGTREELERREVEEAMDKISKIHEDPELGLQCYLCPNYHTKAREYLKSHILGYHLRIKELKCKYCEEQFYRKNVLRTHLLIKHPDLPMVFVRRFETAKVEVRIRELGPRKRVAAKKSSAAHLGWHSEPRKRRVSLLPYPSSLPLVPEGCLPCSVQL